MRNLQFYVSGKRPMVVWAKWWDSFSWISVYDYLVIIWDSLGLNIALKAYFFFQNYVSNYCSVGIRLRSHPFLSVKALWSWLHFWNCYFVQPKCAVPSCLELLSVLLRLLVVGDLVMVNTLTFMMLFYHRLTEIGFIPRKVDLRHGGQRSLGSMWPLLWRRFVQLEIE